MQSTISLYFQSPDTSRLTPASTPAPQAPSIRHPTNTTPVTSGSRVEPVVIPLKMVTNPDNTLFISSGRGGWLELIMARSLSASQVTGATIAAAVPEPTHMDRDSPATSQLELRVLSPQLEQAGSVNPPPHRRRLANNHPRTSLYHYPLLCP